MTEPGYPPPPGDLYGGPPPPMPPGVAAVPPLPWEDRARRGFFPALIETVKLLVTAPSEAFGRAKQRGDYFSPLLFAVLMIVIGTIVAVLWSLLTSRVFPPPDLSAFRDLPPNLRPMFEMMMGRSAAGLLYQFVFNLVASVVLLFVSALIVHLFLLLVGGTRTSKAGIEGTFRAVCYAQASALALVVPFLGPLVYCVWSIILLILGLAALHRTSNGKAAAAALLPILLCCVCAVAGVVLMIGSLAAAFSN